MDPGARAEPRGDEAGAARFERDERVVLGPLAARPYRSLVLLPEPAPPPLPVPELPRIQVERRPLTAYAALAGAGG